MLSDNAYYAGLQFLMQGIPVAFIPKDGALLCAGAKRPVSKLFYSSDHRHRAMAAVALAWLASTKGPPNDET